MELEFVQAPASFCNWVIHPLLLIGFAEKKDVRKVMASEGINKCLEWTDQDNYQELSDEKVADRINELCSLLRDKTKVYINDGSGFCQSRIYLPCLIRAWFRYDLKQADQYVETCLKFTDQWEGVTKCLSPGKRYQVSRYRRPLIVLVCGDRNSAVCFEENISFELKSLPKYSVIVHGGCKGVDLYAAELAKLKGFETRTYPAEWDIFGGAAGPIRNKKMLDNEKPDMVLAFHPDIEISRGTKGMMELAWKDGVPVYIHDLKRKMKFEGDFSVL